jgi:glycosyltransferase involved in cell wall biosynthesis
MILMVGLFPPPLHGMAFTNQSVYELLRARGLEVERLNTAPATLHLDILSRLSRWRGVLHAWGRILRARAGQDQLYIAPSGRGGQVYDVVSLAIARARNIPCTLHHQNYAYLDKTRVLAALMIRMAGPEALHVVLCSSMERVLGSRYGVRRTLVLSNVGFAASMPRNRGQATLHRVGLLSNLTREKGTETVIRLAAEIHRRALPLGVILAGPCLDPDLLRDLEQAVASGILEWRGPVYNEEKAAFWKDIDVFVYPTETDAEPNVVWESLAAGIPVVTYGRGCISEQVGEAGLIIAPSEDFISRALEALEKWSSCADDYRERVRAAGLQYEDTRMRGVQQWERLVTALSGAEAVA